ncbi:MAG TPA: NAD+ synthase [Syntrophomonadaceae bacterium]|nr:NAD+ synthase [Syntrophomonadaceae bacterium]HNX28581.1 NAD+ synthase [Syntrophomonadaceae bacterium]HPR92654.1 NAD+ synthase [Syntrophomonadaceae bacterium]
MNCEAVVHHLVEWLREKVAAAGAKGVVFGLSGGVDSAVTAVIAKRAFPDNCMALLMPCNSPVTDLLHSQMLVAQFDIPYRMVEIENAYNLLLPQYESFIKTEGDKGKPIRANIKPRLRMITLYYSAQSRNYLVVGTSNKSEISIGYSTKYGDSGVDLQLLGDLFKKEVYELAKYLEIPDVIIQKPPSAGLWPDQTDENEMGITYEQLDRYLETGEGEPEVISRIQKMMKASEHKRQMPPIANISR